MTRDELIVRRLTNVLLDAECENLILDRTENVNEQFLAKKEVSKVTLHEIKFLMNRVGTYNNYDINELDSIPS